MTVLPYLAILPDRGQALRPLKSLAALEFAHRLGLGLARRNHKRQQVLRYALLADLVQFSRLPKALQASAFASLLAKGQGYQFPKIPMASALELLSVLVVVLRLPKLEADQHLLFQLDQVAERHQRRLQPGLVFALLLAAAMDRQHRNKPSGLVIELLRAVAARHHQRRLQLALVFGSLLGLALERHLRRQRQDQQSLQVQGALLQC